MNQCDYQNCKYYYLNRQPCQNCVHNCSNEPTLELTNNYDNNACRYGIEYEVIILTVLAFIVML